MNNKFDNILNINEWTTEELEQAVKYYTVKKKDSRMDNQELSWYNRAITKCNNLLESPSEWESMFQ